MQTTTWTVVRPPGDTGAAGAPCPSLTLSAQPGGFHPRKEASSSPPTPRPQRRGTTLDANPRPVPGQRDRLGLPDGSPGSAFQHRAEVQHLFRRPASERRPGHRLHARSPTSPRTRPRHRIAVIRQRWRGYTISGTPNQRERALWAGIIALADPVRQRNLGSSPGDHQIARGSRTTSLHDVTPVTATRPSFPHDDHRLPAGPAGTRSPAGQPRRPGSVPLLAGTPPMTAAAGASQRGAQ